MKRAERDGRTSCPVDALLHQISGPWTLYLLWVLQTEGPMRFSALQARVQGIAPKILTDRLRQLETMGLVSRDYKPTIPPSVTYALTARAGDLKPALAAIHDVALKWSAEGVGCPSGQETSKGAACAPLPPAGALDGFSG
jgi:DNA-binding HxlR family transcriptional regulator